MQTHVPPKPWTPTKEFPAESGSEADGARRSPVAPLEGALHLALRGAQLPQPRLPRLQFRGRGRWVLLRLFCCFFCWARWVLLGVVFSSKKNVLICVFGGFLGALGWGTSSGEELSLLLAPHFSRALAATFCELARCLTHLGGRSYPRPGACLAGLQTSSNPKPVCLFVDSALPFGSVGLKTSGSLF